MKRFILMMAIFSTFSMGAFANWRCHDGAGSSIQVIRNNSHQNQQFLNEKVILKGPVVSQLFSDGHRMKQFGDIYYNPQNQAFEFMSRGYGKFKTNRCTRGGFCAMTNQDYRGVKLSRPHMGDWYFGYCQ